jgi:hypothetical protein
VFQLGTIRPDGSGTAVSRLYSQQANDLQVGTIFLLDHDAIA